jgi:CRISPR-associated endonuclease Csn1
MSNLTLGLDLGSNSIGWALLDETNHKIMGTGVRAFPEGVDRNQQGGELSKNETRRIARGMRRQIARRGRRKRKLREALLSARLLPDNPREQTELVLTDPYQLRRLALDEQLSPFEIGQMFVHLNQRRGFQSNRKADRARKNENSEMLEEISQLAAEIKAAGHRTLGEHLANLVAKPGEIPLQTVRRRHTRRDMYLQEFERIWATQQIYYPTLLTPDLHDKLHRIIFFQREMYWPKSVIGRCELESRLPRCPRADRRAQRFRLLQEVNNLRLLDSSTGEERSLMPEERSRLITYLTQAKERSFEQIRKKLELLESVRFNLERGDRKKLLGMTTDAAMSGKSRLDKTWREESDEDKKNRLVSAIIDGNEDRIRQLLATDWLVEDQKIIDLDLGDGYSSLSLHAIKKLLPHLERGLPMMTRNGTPSALSEAGYLRPDQREVTQQKYLPDPPEVTNPLVRAALHEVRKVLNAILRELVYKNGHTLSHIHIELAREVRGTSESRKRMSRDMRDREAKRKNAADKIHDHGVKPTRETIDRYLLWEEQNTACIYSGQTISMAQLLGGEVDVDHILPYPRCLDNSLMNRVVCFRSENAAKTNHTPYEWLAASDPDKYDKILQRAARLPYNKANRFRQKDVTLDDFFARQFVDTTYITTQVHTYVRCLGADVVCPKGQHTADLRWQWGLGTLLQDIQQDSPEWQTTATLAPGEKNRLDHRHHAIDAIVIALTNRSRLQRLAGIRRRSGSEQTGEILPEPWLHFRADAEAAIRQINVSHHVRRKVKGALHKETLYGPTAKPHHATATINPDRRHAKDWIEEPKEFVYRKPLEELTPPMIEKIRDPAIRTLVTARLREHGIEPKCYKKKFPTEVWKKPLTMPSGVPIRRVRIVILSNSIRPIRSGSNFVEPGNTHHVCLFEVPQPDGRSDRDAVFVTMLDAIERVKIKQPIIQRHHPDHPNARFLMSLSMNEMVLLKHKDKEALYRFDTASSTSGQMWFRHHTAAGKSAEKFGQISKKPSTFDGRKVTVDPLGRIRWAND